MRRIASLILTIGIVGLVLTGSEIWMAAHEPPRPAPGVGLPASRVSVAGVSQSISMVADQIDEPVDAPAVDPEPVDATAFEAQDGDQPVDAAEPLDEAGDLEVAKTEQLVASVTFPDAEAVWALDDDDASSPMDEDAEADDLSDEDEADVAGDFEEAPAPDDSAGGEIDAG